MFLRLFFSPRSLKGSEQSCGSQDRALRRGSSPEKQATSTGATGCQGNVGCFSQLHKIRGGDIFPLLQLFRVNISFKVNTGGAGPREARYESPDGLPLGPSMKLPAGTRCLWGSQGPPQEGSLPRGEGEASSGALSDGQGAAGTTASPPSSIMVCPQEKLAKVIPLRTPPDQAEQI